MPFPLSVKVTPAGSVPVLLSVGGVGNSGPVVMVKLLAVPTMKMAWLGEVIAGASSTVRVKAWVAAGLTPLNAVIVSR